MLLFLVLFFAIGLFFGSFLTVLIDRIPRNESIFGRSYCEVCKSVLSWKDLIPIVSFASLLAKCRYCKAPLSYYYPLIELVTGIIFSLTFLYVWNNFQANILALTFYLFISSSLIVIFFSDLRYEVIPNKILFPTFFLTVFYILFFHTRIFYLNLLSSIGLLVFFLIIYLITRGKGMGLGDVKFAGFMGFLLGFPQSVLSVYLAFLTGGISAIILVLWRKKRFGRKDTIPFGPFLVEGTFLSLFFGDRILNFSTGLLGI
ncbi:MAG: Type 4 prepilin-like protein leader peptide-processing enzyme [Candidatus Levybacteria bacterium GW2011_GWA2_40_8]|nr:MAG: Type 4 prepilin-like protein leader peptide-processing enzyme [Candidatus Levybacteria bacterium GW2011_GWA2_40_8]